MHDRDQHTGEKDWVVNKDDGYGHPTKGSMCGRAVAEGEEGLRQQHQKQR
jgi:hypothetical protein